MLFNGLFFDLNKKELRNFVVQNLSSAPSSPLEGQPYFDTTLHQFGVYSNSTWIYLTAAGSANVSKTANASAVNALQVSGGADKSIKDFLSAGGIIKVDSAGIVSIAVAGTDYVTGASTNTFTNKTFDATASGNVLSNLATSMFAAGVIDTDTALAGNSDTKLATQKAVKAYVDAKTTSALVYKGVIDASAAPNYPASAGAGEMYKISVAGLIGGAGGSPVQAGDTIYSTAASAAGTQAAVGANWDIVQANVDQASTSALGLTTYATQAETEAKSSNAKAVTPSGLVNFTQKKIFTIGDGATTAIAVSDNLATLDKIAEVRDASTNAKVLCEVTYASNTTTFTFGTAPATNSYKVVIIG